LLALHKDDNSAFFDELIETAWLEISIFDLQETDSVPGLQSPDYEQERIEKVWIVFERRIEGDELSKLRIAFSLDHLAEADFNIHEPIQYQFKPYINPRRGFTENGVGSEPGMNDFENWRREV
jgi:hypothetical protein